MADTWDLTRCIVTVNGLPVGGFNDGDAVTVALNEDAFKLHVGADGEATRSKTNNRSGKITFNLRQLGITNTAFEAARKLDEYGNLGQVAIYIKDLNSGSEAFAPAAWVMKAPDMKFAMEQQQREWVFESGRIEMTHVGVAI